MVFRSPPTIIYGKGTVTSVGEQAARFGKKAVLICGKGSLRKSGVLDIIVSSLEKAGVSCAVYDRVGSDPTTSDVDEGAAFAKENGFSWNRFLTACAFYSSGRRRKSS